MINDAGLRGIVVIYIIVNSFTSKLGVDYNKSGSPFGQIEDWQTKKGVVIWYSGVPDSIACTYFDQGYPRPVVGFQRSVIGDGALLMFDTF